MEGVRRSRRRSLTPDSQFVTRNRTKAPLPSTSGDGALGRESPVTATRGEESTWAKVRIAVSCRRPGTGGLAAMSRRL